jgi:hypothetical protein
MVQSTCGAGANAATGRFDAGTKPAGYSGASSAGGQAGLPRQSPCLRLCRPHLSKAFLRCFFTVLTLTARRVAISLFVRP